MKNFFTRMCGVVMGIMLVASVASAANRFPNATCPDSVTMPQINNAGFLPAICKVNFGTTGTPTDTVSGVAGIIVGFDAIPTGYDMFIENTPAGPWSGIDVFTHGTNFKPILGLSLGDSISVEFAGAAIFAGDVEIMAPNNTFAGPNIIIRKCSSGNALPPFINGTTTQFKETPTNTFAEQYKGQLVSITGPLTVARTSLQVPSIGTSNSFLCISASAPSDSVFIEGNKLTTYTPPPNGTVISSVQGIMLKATRGFRILLRNGNDIVASTPPGVADAYPIADTQVRVLFDRDVTPASATNVNNYSLASFGVVTNAVMEGTSNVVLTINNGLSHGDAETVTINNVVAASNNLAMNTPQSKSIINGVLNCAEIQAPNPDSLAAAPCVDISRFAGSRNGGQGIPGPKVGMTGVVTAQYGNLFYFQDASLANRRAITIFAPPLNPIVGHKAFVAGQTQWFNGETEITAISDVADLGPVATLDPVTQTVATLAKNVCDATQSVTDGHDYLSMLVNVHSVKVVKTSKVFPNKQQARFGFYVTGENPAFTDTIFVSNQNTVLGAADSVANPVYGTNGSPLPVGTVLDITGVMHFASNCFQICPRFKADLAIHGLNVGVPTAPAKLAFSVYPNPSRVAKIAFTLPTTADVELGVYDVTGREVAQLAKGRMPAGSYSQAWSGKDASGKQVGAGVYFYRLKAGNDVRTARTTMLGN